MFSGISDKLNTAAGGGRESEKNEDFLDKGASYTTYIKERTSLLTSACVRRRRLCPGEVHGPGPAGQRERGRAGKGREDFGFHSIAV